LLLLHAMMPAKLRSSNQFAKGCRDLLRPVWLSKKSSATWQLGGRHMSLARGHDQGDRRPSLPHRLREFEAVHRTGHLDVREDGADVVSALEDANRLIRIRSFNGFESSGFDHVGRTHAKHVFILDD
jgi:hypothetical protein